jgi:hypothetical protein
LVLLGNVHDKSFERCVLQLYRETFSNFLFVEMLPNGIPLISELSAFKACLRNKHVNRFSINENGNAKQFFLNSFVNSLSTAHPLECLCFQGFHE